jgi:AMMECR1 domain-containing protein
MAIVEIEKPQVAKTVAVVVNHPSGTALPDVTVEERSDDWKTVLR